MRLELWHTWPSVQQTFRWPCVIRQMSHLFSTCNQNSALGACNLLVVSRLYRVPLTITSDLSASAELPAHGTCLGDAHNEAAILHQIPVQACHFLHGRLPALANAIAVMTMCTAWDLLAPGNLEGPSEYVPLPLCYSLGGQIRARPKDRMLGWFPALSRYQW